MATENRNLIAGIKQFDGKGFYAWKIRIRAALDEIGVLKVISDDFEAMSDKTFNQANKKAKNVIIQNLHDRILHSVHDKEKAKDIMDCLEKTYARSGLSEQIELKGKLNNMKFKNGALAEYFEEFDRVVTDLANAGGNLTDQEIVAILLSGMPRSYNSVTASLDIFSSETEFDIHFVKNKLLLEESRQRKQGHNNSIPSAFMGHSQRGRGKARQFQGKKNNTNTFPYRCYKCHEIGHKRSDCPQNNINGSWKPIGSQTQGTESKSTSVTTHRNTAPRTAHVEAVEDEEIAFVCNLENTLETPGKVAECESAQTVEFLVDSGSSDHLINDDIYLTEVEELQNPIIIRVAKEGESLLATKRGTLCTTSCKLKNVLFVPNLRCNLLSVPKMINSGLEIIFKDSKVFVLNKKEQVFLEGQKKGMMLKITFQVRDFNKNSALKAYSICNDHMLWHRRLGHASAGKLKIMLEKNLISIDKNLSKNEIFCEPCVKGRQTKDYCARYDGKTSRPLELIHSDVCGPINPPTHDGKRYILTFHDDFSKFTHVYLLERKSEVPERFKHFVTKMTAQLNSKISRFRCDNGTEYMNNELIDFCETQGRKHCSILSISKWKKRKIKSDSY